MESNKIPLKLGVRCSPPAVTLIYEINQKRRFRCMPIKIFLKCGPGSIDSMTDELRKSHQQYLEKVPDLMIKKMLRILQETGKGTDIEKASKIITNEYSVDPDLDLNKVSEVKLAQMKEIMDSNFIKNQIKKDDPGFLYDVQVNFDAKKKADAGWDSEADDDFWS